MTMHAPPAIARALLRWCLPKHEIADALEGDLQQEFVHRAERGRWRAGWWYWSQVVSLPYVRLHREVRRLGASGRDGISWMGGGAVDAVWREFRVASRTLSRRPLFSTVVVATLAVSIGAATLLYSVVEGVLLKPLPYEEPTELVTAYLTSDEWRNSENELLRAAWDVQPMTRAHTEAFQASPGPLAGFTSYTRRLLPFEARAHVGEWETVQIDASLFAVLGVVPALGRTPSEEEVAQAAPVAVLRHEVWTGTFGADPGVLGQTFELDGMSYTVIGVMPPGFFFPTDSGGDLWIPLTELVREWPSFYGVGRLAPDASIADATTFLEATARRLGEADPDRAGHGGRAVPHIDSVIGHVRGGVRMLFGSALLVVLVACANLGTLFLARTSSRREELAVRASLGAGARSLSTAVLAEVLVLGVLGGGLGLAMAAAALDPFVESLATSLRSLPRRADIALDGRVVLFTTLATSVTVILSGLAPLWATRFGAGAARPSMSRSRTTDAATRRGQHVLLLAQGAMTVMLLAAGILQVRSLLATTAVDLGVRAEGVQVLALEVDTERLPPGPERMAALDAVRERLGAATGASASLVSSLPGSGGVLLARIREVGADDETAASVLSVSVAPDYFETLDIRLLSGRGIVADDDRREVLPAVVSESLAHQLVGSADAVGHRAWRGSDPEPQLIEVVGVAADSRQLSVFQEPQPTLFYPMDERPPPALYAIIATGSSTVSDAAPLAALVHDSDDRIEVSEATTFEQLLSDGVRHIRLRLVLTALLAGLAVLLAMIGIAGVVAHVLSDQRRDVSIRMALGAQGGREVGRVVRTALVPTAVGVILGTALAALGAGIMESMVFGVRPSDPATFVIALSAMLTVAAIAAWIPGRRAASVDPATVLNGS
ncbi:MAG: ABC transporter permease [Gemmatimonadota bacterium]